MRHVENHVISEISEISEICTTTREGGWVPPTRLPYGCANLGNLGNLGYIDVYDVWAWKCWCHWHFGGVEKERVWQCWNAQVSMTCAFQTVKQNKPHKRQQSSPPDVRTPHRAITCLPPLGETVHTHIVVCWHRRFDTLHENENKANTRAGVCHFSTRLHSNNHPIDANT